MRDKIARACYICNALVHAYDNTSNSLMCVKRCDTRACTQCVRNIFLTRTRRAIERTTVKKKSIAHLTRCRLSHAFKRPGATGA